MIKNRKNVTIKPKPIRLKVSMGKISIIVKYIKTNPLIVLLNILILILLFFLSPFLGVATLIIEIILLFLMPPWKKEIKEITHL